MPTPETDNATLARKGRIAGLVIAAAGVVFVLVEAFGVRLGLSSRTIGLIEIVIGAIFLWAIVNAFWMWRARQND